MPHKRLSPLAALLPPPGHGLAGGAFGHGGMQRHGKGT